MSLTIRRTAGVLSTLCLLAACGNESPPAAGPTVSDNASSDCTPADLVIHNTTIYTSNDDQWTAEALAVQGDRIVYVGDTNGIADYLCGDANIMDLSGRTVYAGFTDSHQHLEGVGRRTRTLSLFGIPTLAETVAAIEDWAADIPEGDWVQGRGWIEREWTDEQRFLNKYDVDPFTQNKPLSVSCLCQV